MDSRDGNELDVERVVVVAETQTDEGNMMIHDTPTIKCVRECEEELTEIKGEKGMGRNGKKGLKLNEGVTGVENGEFFHRSSGA